MDVDSSAFDYLDIVKILEVAESSKNIIIVFQLQFYDGNVANYQFRIEKDKIRVGEINSMVI